jgi:opacity protein-like surface antigen
MNTFDRTCITALLGALFALPASPGAAQDWEYSLSVYVWGTGLDSRLETPAGTFDSELSFQDILENLDFAAFATFEARRGRWGLIGDLNYTDVSASRGGPVSESFADAEVGSTLVIASAFGSYATVDRPDLRFELGAGLRAYDIEIDGRLVGVEGVDDRRASVSESWVDPVVGLRMRAGLGERWAAVGYADLGGFGIGEASDLSAQIYAGAEYAFSESWAVQFGYRHLTIDASFDRADVDLVFSGPVLGARFSF